MSRDWTHVFLASRMDLFEQLGHFVQSTLSFRIVVARVHMSAGFARYFGRCILANHRGLKQNRI